MAELLRLLSDRVQFAEPTALAVLPVAFAAVVLVAIVLMWRRRSRPVRTGASSYPLVGRIRWWLAAASILAVAGLAAAQPRVKYGPASFKRGSVDVAVAIDVSASMWVKDLGPSRLDIATREILRMQSEGILQPGDRGALFVFGGTTVRKVHLSPRVERLIEGVQKLKQPATLSGDSFPWDSDVAGAFEHIVQSLDLQDRLEAAVSEDDWRPPRRSDRALLLFTDGDFGLRPEQLQRLDVALGEFRRRGIAVYPLGIGTTGGAELTTILGEYDPEDYDPSLASELAGQRTQLRASTLTFLAERTGGRSFIVDNAGTPAATFLRDVIGSHRGLTFQLVPSEDGLDAWSYLVAFAVLIFVAAVLFY